MKFFKPEDFIHDLYQPLIYTGAAQLANAKLEPESFKEVK